MARKRGRSAPPLAVPLPRIGTVVTIGPADRDRTWRTRVEAVDDTRLTVVAPTRAAGGPVDLGEGRALTLCWPTPLGMVLADGVLVATEPGTIACWLVEVARGAREQRRAAFRLEVQLPAAVRAAEAVSVPVAGRTEDVSEVGVACLVPLADAPALGDEVEVTVGLPDGGPLVAGAWVVHREPLPPRDGEAPTVRLRLALVDDDAERRDRLRRFVLAEQLRRRGARGRTSPAP